MENQEEIKELDKFLDQKKRQIVSNRYLPQIPLARYFDQEKVDFLDPIVKILKNLEKRLKRIESFIKQEKK